MQMRSQLPERWAVQRTQDNYKIVNDWANKEQPDDGSGYRKESGYIHSLPDDWGDRYDKILREDYTEISTVEFRCLVLGEKLKVSDLKENECIHVSTEEEDRQIRQLLHDSGKVWSNGEDLRIDDKSAWKYANCRSNGIYQLNTEGKMWKGTLENHTQYTIYPASWFITTNNNTMNKEIIGYTLKPEYTHVEEAACRIAFGTDKWKTFDRGHVLFTQDSKCAEELQKAGVLNLWFQPVYKKEKRYSSGDWVTVVTADHKDGKWNNNRNYYTVGKTFQLQNFYEEESHGNTYYIKAVGQSSGITANQVRPATEEEIKKAQEEVIQMAEGFQLTIRDKKVFHKEEDITSYIKAMGKWWEDRPKEFGDKHKNWPVKFADIIYEATGCQNKKTSIFDWIKIYNKIK